MTVKNASLLLPSCRKWLTFVIVSSCCLTCVVFAGVPCRDDADCPAAQYCSATTLRECVVRDMQRNGTLGSVKDAFGFSGVGIFFVILGFAFCFIFFGGCFWYYNVARPTKYPLSPGHDPMSTPIVITDPPVQFKNKSGFGSLAYGIN